MSGKKAVVFIVAILSVVVGGCNTRFIPNTEILDNEFNRDVVAFCERYRHAVEDVNVGLLLTLASPRYFDNSGTTTGDDDMDRAGLEQMLKERFGALQAVRYEMKYLDIYEQHGIVYVEYTYTMSFQYKVEDKTRWYNKTADNRLELEPVDGGFLIISGM